jgi:hypothetical protein
MANTATLDLEPADTQSPPPHYTVRVEDDRIENTNADKIDDFASKVTGSFVTTFRVSGSLAGLLAVDSDVGKEYTLVNKVITNVVAYCDRSGSNGAGVTGVDVKLDTTDGRGTFTSIFKNKIWRPNVSCSLGAYTPIACSASNPTQMYGDWSAGKVLRVQVVDAVSALMEGLTVHVFWKHSGSYT